MIFAVILVVCIIAAASWIAWGGEDTILIPFISAVVAMVVLFWGGSVYLFHCDNVATVRYGDEAIAARTAYRDDLRRSLETMRTVPGQLMNQDKPYTTMAEKLAEAEYSLNYTRSMVVQAKIDIESRKIGPWSLIVRWVGER